MYCRTYTGTSGVRRPNTVRFSTRGLNKAITPEEVYQAVKKELKTTATIKCIAELENRWYNVTLDNERHCEAIANYGLILQKVVIQCERASIQSSVVVYVKTPYEFEDQALVNALSIYGTVVNIRRQYHNFDENIETGVRSCLVKNLKKPIPSYLKLGGFSLPVRYRGQVKTCKICQATDHLVRDCPVRGRCFVCGSYDHRASWHDNNVYDDDELSTQGNYPDSESDNSSRTQTIFIPRHPVEKTTKEKQQEEKGDKESGEQPTETEPKRKPKPGQGFWDEAVRKRNTRKRKDRESEGESDGEDHRKIAKDDEVEKEDNMEQEQEVVQEADMEQEQEPTTERQDTPIAVPIATPTAAPRTIPTPTTPKVTPESSQQQANPKATQKAKPTTTSKATPEVISQKTPKAAPRNPTNLNPQTAPSTSSKNDPKVTPQTVAEDPPETDLQTDSQVDPQSAADETDGDGEWVTYTRGGVRRQRKKRTNWQRKKNIIDSSQERPNQQTQLSQRSEVL